MKKRIGLALAAVLFVADAALALERPAPPQVEFGDLFADVELQRIFPDSKEFADATAKSPPDEILALYGAERPATPEALKRFVVAHFVLPAEPAASVVASEPKPIRQHIDELWPILTRDTPTVPLHSSLLPLPRAYVVPGGRFRELYYWDSYFTMLGLAESGRQDLLEDMAQNFAALIDAYGHIPNGTRSYYLTRSQPPFFFAMVGLLAPRDPAAAYARYLPQLKTEYGFWMEGADELAPGAAHRRVVKLGDGSILNRYWDDSDAPRDESYAEDVALARSTPRPPQTTWREIRAAAESGWDFSSRWFADGRTLGSIDTTEIVPVDLNALMFGLENAIRAGCERSGDPDCAADFARRAEARRAAIDRILWDPSRGVYLDYRRTQNERIDRISAATLYPLFTRAASDEQAASVARAVERELLRARRDRRDAGRHRAAMGRAQRLGAAAMDRSFRLEELRPRPARRGDRLPLHGQCRARLSRDRQARRKIRRDRDQPAGRRRRISDPGRLRLDQRRDAEADGALSRRRRSDEPRPLPCAERVNVEGLPPPPSSGRCPSPAASAHGRINADLRLPSSHAKRGRGTMRSMVEGAWIARDGARPCLLFRRRPRHAPATKWGGRR